MIDDFTTIIFTIGVIGIILMVWFYYKGFFSEKK